MLLALILSFSLADASITGVVKDTSGGAVSGASVIVRAESGAERQTVTGPDGRFSLDKVPPGAATLIVRAGGFAVKEQPLTGTDNLEVVVSPAAVLETVTVTATRSEQRLGDIPASVSVLTSEEIKASPALVADDVLRQIPTFSLFRRTSSLSSNPTTQGVSLRGIGPSAVSRTLVLVDGIPFNDPFGGWVYWTRVPLESVDRIEVVDGSTSSLYGNYAMGGVINIMTTHPTRRTFALKPQYGTRSSPKLDFFGGDVWGTLGVAVEGSWFNTDGFPIVAPSEKGIIDNNATVKFRNINVKLDYSPTDRVKAFFRTGYFSEDRGNGKIGEVNDTRWKSGSGGVRIRMPDESDLQASLFIDSEHYHANTLAVTPVSATVVARSIVRLSLDQHVPTNAVGGMVQWGKAVGRSNYFTAGTDWRRVDGDSQEETFSAAPGPVVPPVQQAVLALQRISGGTQRSIGAYVQDVLTPLPKLTVTLSARADHWRNYDAHNLETAVIPGTATNNKPSLPDKVDTVVSPRAAARYQVTGWLSAWGDIGSGFRAPTLKELYRQFRVGTVQTLANDQLGPERLVGGEAGISIAPVGALTIRATWFDNRVTNPVSNVTLTQSGVNVTQQPQNLGKTRIWGVQTDAEYRAGSFWRFSGGYLYNQAKVTDGGANTALVGKFLPQVPAHRGSVHVAYGNPKYANAALGVQFIGRQFDDDANSRGVPAAALSDAGYAASTDPGLPKYAVVDLSASRAIVRGLEVFFGVQNLFDQQYFVGTLPTTIGTPRLAHGGLRLSWSGR